MERLSRMTEKVFNDIYRLFKKELASENLLYLFHCIERSESGKLDLRYTCDEGDGVGEVDNPRVAIRYANLAVSGIRDLEHIKKLTNYLILQNLFEWIFAMAYSGLTNDLNDKEIAGIILETLKNHNLEINEPGLGGFIRQLRIDLKDPHDVFYLQKTLIISELEELTTSIWRKLNN